MMRALGGLGLLVGVGFAVAASRIAFFGTGVALPRGEGALEGRLAPTETVAVPAGEPLIYGEVKLTRPGSRAMEQSWSTIVGSPTVTLQRPEGSVTVRLPTPDHWRGQVPVDTREGVESLEGLPVLGAVADEVRARLQPPFVVLVRGVREGDPIVGQREGDALTNVYVGERAELEAWLQRRERERWPAVVLLAVMAVVSLALGARGLKG